ncbi:MAG: nucleoside deaminase [Oscillospiraceae bacterium]|jgi:tRNA(adenine34) deaminase|nr:nucleoside deaminase [Oscillospiraceae bacterium]
MRDIDFMRQALALAREAALGGEIPVGAVVVQDGKVVGRGRNRRETEQNALCHAEILAIDDACKRLGWRLSNCTLYVTLEPCPMCAGAIINARIKRVVFGAADKKSGCFGSLCDLSRLPFDSRPDLFYGVLEEECRKILEEFFAERRKGNESQEGNLA